MMTYTLEQAAAVAEEALGNNLTRITDLLDLHIRQGNKAAIEALAQLEHAHVALCKAGAYKLPRMERPPTVEERIAYHRERASIELAISHEHAKQAAVHMRKVSELAGETI